MCLSVCLCHPCPAAPPRPRPLTLTRHAPPPPRGKATRAGGTARTPRATANCRSRRRRAPVVRSLQHTHNTHSPPRARPRCTHRCGGATARGPKRARRLATTLGWRVARAAERIHSGAAGGAEEEGLQLSTAARRSGAVLCHPTVVWHGAPRHGAGWHGTARHGMARRTSSRVTSRLNLSCTEASTYTVCSRCTGYNRMHTCTQTHTHIQMYIYI